VDEGEYKTLTLLEATGPAPVTATHKRSMATLTALVDRELVEVYGSSLETTMAITDEGRAELVRHREERNTVVSDYDMLVQRIRVAMPEDSAKAAVELLDSVIAATKREQARRDSELMQKNSDRAPTAPAVKGGTTSRAVFESAARMLDPDQLGWSLELPDHLKDAE
jgi:DNA-binding PadR family transcriptional regulator